MTPKVVSTEMLLHEFERVCLKHLAKLSFEVPSNYTNLAPNSDDPFVVHNTYGARLTMNDDRCSLTAAPRMLPYSTNLMNVVALIENQRVLYFPSLPKDDGFGELGAAWAKGQMASTERWGVFYFINRGWSEPHFMLALP